MKNLAGKTVLITGGALGMGRSLARLFLLEGSRVVLVDIRKDDLDSAVEELGRLGEVVSYICDISDREKVYQLAKTVSSEFGTVDILVNNAGIVKSNPFLEKPDDVIEQLIAVNLMAHFWTMKAFLPGMVAKREGYVVNMSSAGGLLAVPYISDYSASKFAVVGLTEALRQEFKIEGLKDIKFMCVCPNTVGTGLFDGATMVKGTKLLTAEQVTGKIIAGIKKNRSFVGVPASVYIVPLTKAILPPSALDLMNRILGISTSSRTTKGRPDPTG
ncbi:MAG TPA: SDR family oxidoreductase [Candidatus Anoxymicrobiaceae bacterium]|jgi:all-trans-retinol dehydrogenase (NAD+)